MAVHQVLQDGRTLGEAEAESMHLMMRRNLFKHALEHHFNLLYQFEQQKENGRIREGRGVDDGAC